ncbi:561_t:CDS:2, partial [Acaulospora morrowiae]
PTPKSAKDSFRERSRLRKKGQFQRIQPKPLVNVGVNTIASNLINDAERNSQTKFNAGNDFLRSPETSSPDITEYPTQLSQNPLSMEQENNDLTRFQRYGMNNDHLYLANMTTCSLIDPPIVPSHIVHTPTNIEFPSSPTSLPCVSSSSLPYNLPFSGTSSLIMFSKNKQTDDLTQNTTFPEELFFSNCDDLISDDFCSLPTGIYSEIDSNSTVNMNADTFMNAVLLPMNVADIYNVENTNDVVSPMNTVPTNINVNANIYDTINSNITNAIFWMSGDPRDNEH